MSKVPRIALKPAPGTTLETGLYALVTIYGRAIERYEEVKAAGTSGGNDTEGRLDEFRADEAIIPNQHE